MSGQGKDRGYKSRTTKQQQQEADIEQSKNPIVPVFTCLDFGDKKQQRAVFLIAQVLSVEEQVTTTQNNQPKTLIVTLKNIKYDKNTTSKATIKVHPPNYTFIKDLEEKKKEEHYKFFSEIIKKQLESNTPSLIVIYNATIKSEKEISKDPQNIENKVKKQKVIQLKEWSQVQLIDNFIGGIREMNKVNDISSITANDKKVNIFGLITKIQPLAEVQKDAKNSLSTPHFKPNNPDDVPPYHQITIRDNTGEIYCILPNIEKFKNFIQQDKLLFFQNSQIQFSIINDTDRKIFLNIYINEKKQKQKGNIWDCTNLPEFQQTIESFKAVTDKRNVSDKIWVVKSQSTAQ